MSLSGRLWTLLGGGVLLGLLLIAVFLYLVTAEQARVYNAALAQRLRAEARLFGEALPEVWGADDGRVATLIQALWADGTTAVILSADGSVRAGPDGALGEFSDLFEQHEVQNALATGWSQTTRRCGPDDRLCKVVALRVGRDEGNLGVVWMARPVWTLARSGRHTARLVAGFGLVVLIAVAMLA